MTATAHAIIGGAIAASVKDPALGLPLAFLSHPLLDKIPHWDLGWGWRKKPKLKLFLESAGDLILGVALAYLLFGDKVGLPYLSAAVLLAVGLDILEAPYWFLNWKFPPFGLIYRLQSKMQGKAKLPWGFINQVVVVIVVIFLLGRVS